LHRKTCKITVDFITGLDYNWISTGENDMTEFETKCYGMSEADIRQDYMKSLTASHCGLEFVVMGLLSDAQELLGFGNAQALNQSRQNMNIAKFILSEMMDQREKVAK
jgi:hypothetical protein